MSSIVFIKLKYSTIIYFLPTSYPHRPLQRAVQASIYLTILLLPFDHPTEFFYH